MICNVSSCLMPMFPLFFTHFSIKGGRKRRWCVLRTFSPNEASIDLYLDESKTRYKGSISLDKDAAPILMVKNADKKRKAYILLKVGKSSFQFTCDSFRELTEWCALIRQAMDVGTLTCRSSYLVCLHFAVSLIQSLQGPAT